MTRFTPCPLDHNSFPAATALFEVALQAKQPGNRMSSATIAALCLLATGEVRTAREAASQAGVTEANLCRNRRSKHGVLLEREITRLFQKNAGRRAFARIAQLSEQHENLSVAMRASEWVAGVNGLTVEQRQTIEHVGSASPSIGMMVIHPDAISQEQLDALIPVADAAPAIDVTPVEAARSPAESRNGDKRWLDG